MFFCYVMTCSQINTRGTEKQWKIQLLTHLACHISQKTHS